MLSLDMFEVGKIMEKSSKTRLNFSDLVMNGKGVFRELFPLGDCGSK